MPFWPATTPLRFPSRCRRHDARGHHGRERTQLAEIAKLMQRHRIKLVPIVRDGKIIGIVSRANLLQGLLAREPYPADGADDANVRAGVYAELAKHSWSSSVTNVVVDQGVVHLWGNVGSASSKEAVRVAAENIPGVRRVMNNIVVIPSDIYLPS